MTAAWMSQPTADATAELRRAALGDVLREYMEATERLTKTHEVLQRELQRLQHELASKDRALERSQRLAALGELAAGVAHEVRNPLGAIQLYSGLLRKRTAGISEAQALLDKIEASIHAIDEVVSDTLSLTPRRCRLTRCTVRELVETAVSLAQAVMVRCGVHLHVQLEDPDQELRIERDALARVLLNLLSNAADASQRGQTVVLEARAAADGCVRVCVLDEGCGLPPHLLDQLFNPFVTTKEHGTGLGLTIAHRVVEAHGGRLTGGNRPEGGAEFCMELPVDYAGQLDEMQPADGMGQTAAAPA